MTPPSGRSVTIPQAAELLNVGGSSVRRAREVLAHGHDALVDTVEKGQASVNDAAKFAGAEAKTIAEAALRLLPSPETNRGLTPPTRLLAVNRRGREMLTLPMPCGHCGRWCGRCGRSLEDPTLYPRMA